MNISLGLLARTHEIFQGSASGLDTRAEIIRVDDIYSVSQTRETIH